MNPEEVLRRLELTVTRRLDGLLHGEHQGLLPGPGSEAGESRLYQPGDDVRRMDWAVTARTSTPHVRMPIAERELETWVLADLSASLDFGTADREKRDLVAAAVAAVGYLTTAGGNRLGAVLLTADGPVRVPPRSGADHLRAVLHRIVTAERRDGPAPTDLTAGLRELQRLARRRGLAVVVSDFLAPPGWDKALRALAARHEVLAVEVLDPRELELPDVGLLALRDPESGAVLEVQTSDAGLRRRYAEAAAAQRDGIAKAIRGSGADHLRLRTDTDWLHDVVRFVAARRRRRAA